MTGPALFLVSRLLTKVNYASIVSSSLKITMKGEPMDMALHDFFRLIGGYEAVASALGVSKQAVFNWEHKGVPGNRQAALVDYAAVRADRIQVGIRQFISSRGSMEGAE